MSKNEGKVVCGEPARRQGNTGEDGDWRSGERGGILLIVLTSHAVLGRSAPTEAVRRPFGDCTKNV